MQLKSFSGIVLYVGDLKASVDFYTKLGFTFKEVGDTAATGYINWFWIDLVQANSETKQSYQNDAQAERKGDGAFMCLSVDNVDAAYEALVSEGIQPSSEPKDWPYGRREFVVRDPDGYKLVVFMKIKK